MNLEDAGELFNALNEAGIRLGFGRDACTNIPNLGDLDYTGWHLMLHDEEPFELCSSRYTSISWSQQYECDDD